jgi:hypothetical protein
MGYLEPNIMFKALLKDCGHDSRGPIELLDQSNERIRSNISPEPASQSEFVLRFF